MQLYQYFQMQFVKTIKSYMYIWARLFESRLMLTQDYTVKVNQSINFSCIKMFLASYFCLVRDYSNSKEKA